MRGSGRYQLSLPTEPNCGQLYSMMSRADESRASTVATAIIISPTIAAVAVVLRLYTRTFLLGKRFPEDYCIGLAMVRHPSIVVHVTLTVISWHSSSLRPCRYSWASVSLGFRAARSCAC